jgi:hypothetical protein
MAHLSAAVHPTLLGCMMQPVDHRDCAGFLRTKAARLGMRVTVTFTVPGTETNPATLTYPPQKFVCPHGDVLWIHPTVDQEAEWIATQTP